jgi:hypothetical protein
MPTFDTTNTAPISDNDLLDIRYDNVDQPTVETFLEAIQYLRNKVDDDIYDGIETLVGNANEADDIRRDGMKIHADLDRIVLEMFEMCRGAAFERIVVMHRKLTDMGEMLADCRVDIPESVHRYLQTYEVE